MERSASEQLVEHYQSIENELAAFRSKKSGYVKKRDYSQLLALHDELSKKNKHSETMI